jgi:hypothetical protein
MFHFTGYILKFYSFLACHFHRKSWANMIAVAASSSLLLCKNFYVTHYSTILKVINFVINDLLIYKDIFWGIPLFNIIRQALIPHAVLLSFRWVLITFLYKTFIYRATDMNEHSSRSHAIFIITIECSEVKTLHYYCILLFMILITWLRYRTTIAGPYLLGG